MNWSLASCFPWTQNHVAWQPEIFSGNLCRQFGLKLSAVILVCTRTGVFRDGPIFLVILVWRTKVWRKYWSLDQKFNYQKYWSTCTEITQIKIPVTVHVHLNVKVWHCTPPPHHPSPHLLSPTSRWQLVVLTFPMSSMLSTLTCPVTLRSMSIASDELVEWVIWGWQHPSSMTGTATYVETCWSCWQKPNRRFHLGWRAWPMK